MDRSYCNTIVWYKGERRIHWENGRQGIIQLEQRRPRMYSAARRARSHLIQHERGDWLVTSKNPRYAQGSEKAAKFLRLWPSGQTNTFGGRKGVAKVANTDAHRFKLPKIVVLNELVKDWYVSSEEGVIEVVSWEGVITRIRHGHFRYSILQESIFLVAVGELWVSA